MQVMMIPHIVDVLEGRADSRTYFSNKQDEIHYGFDRIKLTLPTFKVVAVGERVLDVIRKLFSCHDQCGLVDDRRKGQNDCE